MTDPADSLDADMAAVERLRVDLARAIAACEAEHEAGRIGYEAFRVAKVKRDELLVAAGALQRRLAEALDTLAATSTPDQGESR